MFVKGVRGAISNRIVTNGVLPLQHILEKQLVFSSDFPTES